MPAPLATRPARAGFVCGGCGAAATKWQGRCDGCGEWNTLAEAAPRPAGHRGLRAGPVATPLALDVVAADAVAQRRLASGLAEVDRVLGGGVVPGALVLLGGDPGIGKSTLALAVAAACGSATAPALYLAGEESAGQLAMRARRTGCAGPGVLVLTETDVATIVEVVERTRPPLAVVDSVQTLDSAEVGGSPGSVAQVRDAVGRLLALAKSTGTAVVLVGHVTKDGAIAGPRTLEHMVDVVLHLEGDRHGDHRLLRGVKNRFGATDDIGVLVMDDSGIRDSPAPGRAFVEEGSLDVAGTVLTVTCEGSRPLVVEVQALVVPTAFPSPRRTASGFDLARLHLLLAVLEKRGGTALASADVYLNVVGGVHLAEPAVDLAVALAVASAAEDRPLPRGLVAVGELGLGGEVRGVRRLAARVGEAVGLGLTTAVLPAGQRLPAPGLDVAWVSRLTEALAPWR